MMKRLLEDGLLYYTVIFALALVLTIMIIAAPPGLKAITAQAHHLLSVVMMSRITINLARSITKAFGTGSVQRTTRDVGPQDLQTMSYGKSHTITDSTPGATTIDSGRDYMSDSEGEQNRRVVPHKYGLFNQNP
jgi:hypothetical protein